MKSPLAQMRFRISKCFHPTTNEVLVGQYKIVIIPCSSPGVSEALLQLESTYVHPIGESSNPEEEAVIVCEVLSALLNARMALLGFRIDVEHYLALDRLVRYPNLEGLVETTNLDADFNHILSLDDDLARQYIRACHAYSFALNFIPADPAFAFLLLVVAIECLSSQNAVIPFEDLAGGAKKCERFRRFIETYVPTEKMGEDDAGKRLVRELLKTVYNVQRSAFVHGGKEISAASLQADRAGTMYFRHATDGREEKAPGLSWFADMVNASLVGFLRNEQRPRVAVDSDRISRIAMERGMLKLKAKRAVGKGEAITFDDIEHQ
jgi:hypothetical protein